MVEYTVYYALTKEEYQKFIDLIIESSNMYSAFAIVFLKELNGDINKMLRIINVGIKSKRKIFNTALYNFIVITIKEAIILANYKSFMDEDGFFKPVVLAKEHRFTIANIDRQTIIRTLKKYGITYR